MSLASPLSTVRLSISLMSPAIVIFILVKSNIFSRCLTSSPQQLQILSLDLSENSESCILISFSPPTFASNHVFHPFLISSPTISIAFTSKIRSLICLKVQSLPKANLSTIFFICILMMSVSYTGRSWLLPLRSLVATFMYFISAN